MNRPTPEEKKAKRVDRLVKRFMHRREFVAAAIGAGIAVPGCSEGAAQRANANWKEVLSLAYETFAGAAWPALPDDDRRTIADDPNAVYGKEPQNGQKGRPGTDDPKPDPQPSGNAHKYFKWRLKLNFHYMVAEQKRWPNDAHYVLFNAARMGADAKRRADQAGSSVFTEDIVDLSLAWVKENVLRERKGGASPENDWCD